jgi:glutathione peroxidase
MKTALLFFTTLLLMSFSPEKTGTVYDFSMKSIDGKDVSLSTYKGKKLLIVNVASKCGYTPQYKELEALSKKYAGKLVVLGFPANNFGSQEPGTNEEIQGFCQKNYGVTFPMFAKVSVKGKDVDPLFAFLSNKEENGGISDAPTWNFCKYLIDENGKVKKFFGSSTSPMSKDITDLL